MGSRFKICVIYLKLHSVQYIIKAEKRQCHDHDDGLYNYLELIPILKMPWRVRTCAVMYGHILSNMQNGENEWGAFMKHWSLTTANVTINSNDWVTVLRVSILSVILHRLICYHGYKPDAVLVCWLWSYPFNDQIIKLEFSPTWSCVSLTRSTTSSEWKLLRLDKMEVNDFEILVIYVTFYL